MGLDKQSGPWAREGPGAGRGPSSSSTLVGAGLPKGLNVVTETEEGYAVFLRSCFEHRHGIDSPGDGAEELLPRQAVREELIATCGSAGEARRIKRERQARSELCVIRFLGETGGGD